MRLTLLLPVLALAACDVQNDTANNQVRVDYDREQIEQARDTAGNVASGIGNVASSTGSAIKNEVGDIDVDVNVRRDRDGNEAEPAADKKQ